MKFSEHPDYVKYRTIPNYLYAKIALEQCGKCGCGCGRDLEFEQRKYALSILCKEHLAASMKKAI